VADGISRPALAGRLGDWGRLESKCKFPVDSLFVCECHNISTLGHFQPPPRRTQRAVSRTTLSCLLRPTRLGDPAIDDRAPQISVGRSTSRHHFLASLPRCRGRRLHQPADKSTTGSPVAREPDELLAARGKPETIVSDNGTELTSRAALRWSEDHRLGWHYIASGKPEQNAFIESFRDDRIRDSAG
jgi:hypothetical protein